MFCLISEAAHEASTLASRKFEQERNKLIESSNDMENEIQRLRKLVVENARLNQSQQSEPDRSPATRSPQQAEANLHLEDEIEMLKVQLATANQEITKLTLDRDKLKKELAEEIENPLRQLSKDEANTISDKLASSEQRNKELVASLAKAESDLNSFKMKMVENLETCKIELKKYRDSFQSVVETNKRLTFFYAKKAQEMREEEISLPSSFDELLTTALMLREQVILERANREAFQEKSSQEIDLLRSELQAEQNERQQMEQLLSSEMDSLRHELSKEKGRTRSTTSQVTVVEGPDPNLEMEQYRKRNAVLESEVGNLKGQCARLQIELDTSESVQQDLVRLSQNLQVGLPFIAPHLSLLLFLSHLNFR